VKLETGDLPSAIYRRQPPSVRDKPKSGVFRDFAEYGVHPARVVVLNVEISVPFLVSMLTATQLSMEITNQRQRTAKKPDGSKYPEEEEAGSADLVIGPGGTIRKPPSGDAAHELITILRERKRYIDWTTPMQKLISALNLYIFRQGTLESMPLKFVTPPRERAMLELTPLIPPALAKKEIENRALKDPGHWGTTNVESITLSDIAYLMGELMTTTAYTSEMRQVVEWYKNVYRRMQMQTLITNILNHEDIMIATLRVRSSLKA
jgi:hypothetical protein